MSKEFDEKVHQAVKEYYGRLSMEGCRDCCFSSLALQVSSCFSFSEFAYHVLFVFFQDAAPIIQQATAK